MIVRNMSKNNIIASSCTLADSFFSRLIGLIGKKNMLENTALYITKCNSIHMFFMKFPIDVCFLSKDNEVVHILENFKPWNISKIIKNAQNVIELPCNSINKYSIELGDQFYFENSDA